jgi:hypothetical protein
MLSDRFMIYGTDEPQRAYLAVTMLARRKIKYDNASITALEVTGYWNPTYRDGRAVPVVKKADFDRVSNYFIDFNKQGEVLPTGVGGVTHNRIRVPYVNYRSEWMKDREEERRDFHERFDDSPLGLKHLDRQHLGNGARKDRQDANTSGNWANMLNNFAVRRACKFLMYDTVERDNANIAYALDGMDLGLVARRGARALGSGSMKVPVCTSEIRELFRNWDRFKDYVKFFEDFQEVDAPWERTADIDIWADYARRSATKIRDAYGDIGNTGDNMQAVIDKTASFGAVRSFHNSFPSIYTTMGLWNRA